MATPCFREAGLALYLHIIDFKAMILEADLRLVSIPL